MTKLKKLRLAANLTQRELAEQLNISAAAVSLQEKRGVPNFNLANRYALVLGCSPEDLLETKKDTTITRDIGDIVYLKSGGPAMVVSEIRKDGVVSDFRPDGVVACWKDGVVSEFRPDGVVACWFDGAQIAYGLFNPATLTRSKPE